MSAHTPGEWVTGGESDPLSILSTPTYWKVAEVNDALDEAPANARLIAAAPQLLKALRVMVTWYGRRESASTHGLPTDDLLPYSGQEPEVQAAMDAIAKATSP